MISHSICKNAGFVNKLCIIYNTSKDLVVWLHVCGIWCDNTCARPPADHTHKTSKRVALISCVVEWKNSFLNNWFMKFNKIFNKIRKEQKTNNFFLKKTSLGNWTSWLKKTVCNEHFKKGYIHLLSVLFLKTSLSIRQK